MEEKNGPLLLHCVASIERAGVSVLGWLQREKELSPMRVRSRKAPPGSPVSNPNPLHHVPKCRISTVLGHRSHHIRPRVCILQLAGWPRGEQAEDGRALQVDGRRRQLQLEIHLPLRLSPCRANVLHCKKGERLCADVCAFSGLICLTRCKSAANRLLFV